MANRDGSIGMIQRSYRSWFADLGPGAEISEIWSSSRPQSAIARYSIRSGEQRHDVIVKTNRLTPPSNPRPRLGLTTDFDQKHHFEAAALDALSSGLSTQPDDLRFDHLRVLATTDDEIVVDALDARDLGMRIRVRHGLGAGQLVERAAALLRHFHESRPTPDVPSVRSDVASVVASFHHFTSFLAEPLDAAGLRRPVADLVDTLATDLERAPLTLGLGHGDFAPRNILVDARDRMTLIDPLGCQRVPVEEDLAYFALALRRGALVPWIPTVSWRVARTLEQRMLAGYQFPPDRLIRYHGLSVLVLLDAWAADHTREAHVESGVRAMVRRTLPTFPELVRDQIQAVAAV